MRKAIDKRLAESRARVLIGSVATAATLAFSIQAMAPATAAALPVATCLGYEKTARKLFWEDQFYYAVQYWNLADRCWEEVDYEG